MFTKAVQPLVIGAFYTKMNFVAARFATSSDLFASGSSNGGFVAPFESSDPHAALSHRRTLEPTDYWV